MERSCSELLLVLLCLVNLFVVISATSRRRNIADDQSALLAFKSLITNNDILSNNWSTNISPCNWIGVSCSIRHQRVTALNLNNMSLSGTISPHLGNLSFLLSLNVSFNSFHGLLPEELAHLRRLKEMDLGYNQLSGSIPAILFNMSSLTLINLSNNSLSESLPVSFCKHLPKLERLSLQSNRLNGQIPSKYLHKCKKLRALSLSANNFSGSIPREIGNLTMLREIYLGKNGFEGAKIPMEIGNLKHLEILNMVRCFLKGSIPSFIFNISSLITIDLADNNLNDSLPVEFCKNLPKLKVFSLLRNQLDGQIPTEYLYKCKALQVLQLDYNKFTGSIPCQIGNLTMLRILTLSFNRFEGTLPHEIANLKNLETFSVGNNSLGENIPFSIFNISTVKVLDLAFNHFTSQFPSTMEFWLPNLEQIYLAGNTFSGTLPESISNSSKLFMLELSSNSFTGSIPNSLGNLRLLRSLDLADNDLTMEPGFFTSLTNCRFLRLLIVSTNPINGILPTSIGNLSASLQDIYADSCKFKGQIPLQIGNLSSLRALVLNENELAGPIPITMGRMKHLERLILEDNRLQGSIPKDLCQLTRLGQLSLASNRLNGFIPECFGELKSLSTLSLSSNEFNSTIPLTLWSINTLLGLDFSSNLLSGNLPSNIGNLQSLVYLDLSWNQLSGDIPSTIGDMKMLSSLFLVHNKLQGSIPQELGKLISLEDLDLSNNNLSGVIPKSLEALKNLEHLNVSFNRLRGEIPVGGKFGDFSAESFMENDGLCGAPHLQVPPCKAATLRHSRSRIGLFLKYILPVIASVVIFVFAIIVLLKRRQNENIRVLAPTESLLILWRRVSYNDLVRATEAFSESNLLGVGSFGSVYKGVLSDGKNVAVKVFNMQCREIRSFNVECEVLSKVRHRNLVGIISSCSNVDFKALILEYIPYGSLEKWLYSHNYCLDIIQRLNIMQDVALALEYLHHGHSTAIVHCDLKPTNVLVDEDMVAHVCDFGISKFLGEDEFITQTKTLATIGYMAPEYGREGMISTKGDVYSYGILLMETFTRKKPTDEIFSSEMSLRSWVNEHLHGSLLQVVDTNLFTGEDEHLSAKKQCVSSIFDLALDCSKDSHVERISMKEVVVRLEKIKIMFQASTEKLPRKRFNT